jgi:rubrerythrin
MDAAELLEAVREDSRTELSRLGSSKALYADTMGEMETAAVLRSAATAEHAAAETYDSWADSEDGDVAEAFRATAEEERSHYETVLEQFDGDHDPEAGELPAIQSYLRGLEGSVERVGGFLGRTLAAEKSKDQVTGFFVGQAKPRVASTFRGMGGDLDAQLERATALLEELCDTDEDWERAREAANGAITAAYDEYVERLEGMGVNPKPVC